MLELHCTEPEMIALEAKFCNDTGFNYLAFLAELQPEEPQKFMYETRLEEIRQTNVRKTLPELNAQKDLENILLKIKTKVRGKGQESGLSSKCKTKELYQSPLFNFCKHWSMTLKMFLTVVANKEHS